VEGTSIGKEKQKMIGKGVLENTGGANFPESLVSQIDSRSSWKGRRYKKRGGRWGEGMPSPFRTITRVCEERRKESAKDVKRNRTEGRCHFGTSQPQQLIMGEEVILQ